jgi:hypothetical protein
MRCAAWQLNALATLLRVATPRNLTQRQRELLEEFSAAGDEQRAKAG